MQLHGGNMSINSHIGQGTRVTVRLPLDCERAQPARKPAARQPAGVVSYLAATAHEQHSGPAGEAAPLLERQDIHQDIQVRKSA